MMLIKANLAGDMRRLHAADGAPFAEVSAQVRSLFAGDQPAGATFAFGFIDEDGDNISIVTDADWQEAVAFFEGKAVRVTVTALQAAAPAAVPTAVPATAASFAAALCAPFNAAKAEADLAQAELADIAQAEDAQADPAEAAADASGGDEDADADTMANLKATLDEIAERVNAGDLTFIAAAQEVFAAGRAAVDAAITQCAETDVGRTIKDVYANVSELCEEQLAAFLVKCGCCCCCNVFLVICFLIVFFEGYVSPTEFGIHYNSNVKKLHRDRVFQGGRHLLGWGHEFKRYP